MLLRIMVSIYSSLGLNCSVLLLLITRARATCYNPDGSVFGLGNAPLSLAFQPCNQVAGASSMCCGTNWTGGVVEKDVCHQNGLCLNSFDDKPLYWRSACTDPTWKSPNCLSNLCTSTTVSSYGHSRTGTFGGLRLTDFRLQNGGDPTGNVAVLQCADGSWCCGGSNTTCCDEKLVRISP